MVGQLRLFLNKYVLLVILETLRVGFKRGKDNTWLCQGIEVVWENTLGGRVQYSTKIFKCRG